jgi:hypothetical protein
MNVYERMMMKKSDPTEGELEFKLFLQASFNKFNQLFDNRSLQCS